MMVTGVNATGTGGAAHATNINNGTSTWAPTVVTPTIAPAPSDGAAADELSTSLMAAVVAFGGLTWAFAEL